MAPTRTLVRGQVKLRVEKEVVCMAVGDGLLAVGSQSHASLVDPRCQAPVQDVASLDTDHGARPQHCCVPVRLGANRR